MITNAPTTHCDRDLIASLLIDPSWCDRVCEIATAADFSDPDLGRLYDALLTLHATGTPLGDMHLVVPALRAMRLPTELTKASWLAGLMRSLPSAAHARHYAIEVRRESQLRRLVQIALAAQQAAQAAKADPSQITATLDAQLRAIAISDEHPPERIGQTVQRVVDDLLAPRPSSEGSILTGIPSLDQVVGGWVPGDFVLLAARPGVGKTALASQVALHQAVKGRTVGLVSLEMTREEIAQRYIAALTGVDIRRLRSRNLESDHRRRIADIRSDFDSYPLSVWSPPHSGTGGIRAYAKKLAAGSDGLALLVVDYVSLIRSSDRYAKPHERVAQHSRELKAIAKEVSVPLLCLAQLNRDSMKRGKGGSNLPGLEHLAESDALGRDADIALFIHREETGSEEAKLVVAKHRNGQCGVLTLHFDGKRTLFSDPPVTSYANYDNRLAGYGSNDNGGDGF